MSITATIAMAPGANKILLDDSDCDSDAGGVQLTVNKEYAKRFEHNKKREERQRRTSMSIHPPNQD